MSSTKKQPPRFHIGDWVRFDYGPKKVSARIVEDRGLLGVHGRRLYRVQLDDTLGQASTFEMPENELETEMPPLRLSYAVKYVRLGDGNDWDASTRRERLLRGVKAKGAVAYTTAFFEGEQSDDRRSAAVQVLLEVDPRFDEVVFNNSPPEQQKLATRAQTLADEMFLSRHPRAKIKHTERSE